MIGAHDRPLFPRCVLAADAELVLDRCLALAIRRIPSIDGRTQRHCRNSHVQRSGRHYSLALSRGSDVWSCHALNASRAACRASCLTRRARAGVFATGGRSQLPPEAGGNRHLRPVNSPPAAAGTEVWRGRSSSDVWTVCCLARANQSLYSIIRPMLMLWRPVD